MTGQLIPTSRKAGEKWGTPGLPDGLMVCSPAWRRRKAGCLLQKSLASGERCP